MNILGIDLGGTKIAIAKYDSKSWQKLDETQTKTKTSVEAVISQLIELIQQFLDNDTKQIGIGVPGPTLNGIVKEFPNIPGAENFDLKSSLEKKIKLPISIENDANCFTIGAWQLSEHKDKQNILGLTIGTGVGGGVIQNGKLLRGEDGSTGEFGHDIIRDGKELEDLISGPALKKRWQEKYDEKKSASEIVKAADGGEQKAISFLETVGEDLNLALSTIAREYNPQLIFIGGSASAPLNYYLKKIESKIPIIHIQDQDCATFGAAWLAQNPS